MLGTHCPPHLSYPVLMDMARKGRYSLGRKSAVEGLEYACYRLVGTGAARDRKALRTIRAFLEGVAARDSNADVRLWARIVLDWIKGHQK